MPPLKFTVPSGCLLLFMSASACASTFDSFIFIVIPCIAFAVSQCDVPISIVAIVCMLFLFLLFSYPTSDHVPRRHPSFSNHHAKPRKSTIDCERRCEAARVTTLAHRTELVSEGFAHLFKRTSNTTLHHRLNFIQSSHMNKTGASPLSSNSSHPTCSLGRTSLTQASAKHFPFFFKNKLFFKLRAVATTIFNRFHGHGRTAHC